jgi:hypothetical protein
MAAKKKTAAKKKPVESKADFIRQHPSKTTDEVIAEAKAIGMTIPKDTIYKVRSAVKKSRRRSAKKASPAPMLPVRSTTEVDDRTFLALIKKNGFAWAKGLMGRAERAIDQA